MKTTLLRACIAVIFLFVIGNNDLSAQILSVGSEQSMNIISGTTFSLDNVVLIPTKNYVLQNNVFDSRNMITKFPNGNAMTKAYFFSEDPLPFSGIMEVRYKDYELNGLNEKSLAIQLYDNIGWNGIESNKRDSKGNAIESKSMYSVLPKEITLGDKNALSDFIVLNNPTTDKVLTIQVNKPLELNLFSIDGKLLVKQYYQTGIQHINVNQYAHATYLLSSGRLTKKIIL